MGTDENSDIIRSEAAIRTTIYRYCAAIDRCRYDWMEQVFHDDAVIRIGRHDSTAAELVDALKQREDVVAASSHMVANILIERVDRDTAFAESYCLAIEQIGNQPTGGDVDRVVRLRYADIFERRRDAWKIAQRKLIVDHAMAPVPSATTRQFGGEKGRRGNADPAMQMRAALGLN